MGLVSPGYPAKLGHKTAKVIVQINWRQALLSFLFLLFASTLLAGQEPAPDLILVNGKIFTSDAAHSYVQALAIRGERIVAAGSSDKIQALAEPQTRLMDLGGRTVIPGINDAHNHLAILPANKVELGFQGPDPTWAEAKQALTAAVLKAPKGTFLFGDIGPNIFHDVEVNRDSLDKVAPDDPVLLTTFTGHAVIANSAALNALKIRQDQPDPLGGRLERFPDGRLSGVLREYAVLNAYRELANITSDDDGVAQLRKTLAQAAKYGITTIQDMSDALTPERCVALLQQVPTAIRIRVIRMPGTLPNGRDIHEGWPTPHPTNSLIRVYGSKWMLDGVGVEGTFAPRSDKRSFAEQLMVPQMTFPDKEQAAMLRESLENDDQLLLHIFGHPAPEAMLKTMQANGGAKVWAARRVRFEHGDGLTPDLIPHVKELGMVVVQNPTHLAARTMIPSIGESLDKVKFQPLRSLLDAGIPLALGSDGPMNPYLNIMFASIHPDRPSEAITREQAVAAYTLGSAYAEFAEKEKGSLEPGKLADLAVLSQDIFSVPPPELPKTESVLTLVSGKAVYDAGVVHVTAGAEVR